LKITLENDLCRRIVEDFLKDSNPCIESIVKRLREFREDQKVDVRLFYGKNHVTTLDGNHFFLRSSVEYSNPQITVEEVQGIVAARLLEVCGNHFEHYGLRKVNKEDIDEVCEMLKKPPSGKIVPFLLNTDDVEPDRYSINPLKESILESGQSAFPSATVKTDELKIDKEFMKKYSGSLISKDEAELIERHLATCKDRYTDMVEAVKLEQLEDLSETFGMKLHIPFIRMPQKTLKEESTDGLLHYIISKSHADYNSIERVYNCMGRSMKHRTTLLTVPHSEKGYGSKRAARGKIYFNNATLKRVKVVYKTTPLYPNSIDWDDISVAKADDHFIIEGNRLTSYNFSETPSSPQFILYSLISPEDAAIWHGLGEFGASQLVRSYISTRIACAKHSIIEGLKESYRFTPRIPLQCNLTPKDMWVHPVYKNIDASIGCVENLADLAKMSIKLECLPPYHFARR
jgi:hypothetical protein